MGTLTRHEIETDIRQTRALERIADALERIAPTEDEQRERREWRDSLVQWAGKLEDAGDNASAAIVEALVFNGVKGGWK